MIQLIVCLCPNPKFVLCWLCYFFPSNVSIQIVYTPTDMRMQHVACMLVVQTYSTHKLDGFAPCLTIDWLVRWCVGLLVGIFVQTAHIHLRKQFYCNVLHVKQSVYIYIEREIGDIQTKMVGLLLKNGLLLKDGSYYWML